MAAGPRRIFVYYRVAPDAEAAAVAAVQRAQAELRRRFEGLATELLRRPADPAAPVPGPVTLMETYAMDVRLRAAGVDEPLQAMIEKMLQPVLAGVLAGPRHVEVFEACAS